MATKRTGSNQKHCKTTFLDPRLDPSKTLYLKGESYIDWSDCPLVACDPERMHRAPCIAGTRMTADTVVECFDMGETVEEICYNYSLTPDIVQALIDYANKRHPFAGDSSEWPPLRQE